MKYLCPVLLLCFVGGIITVNIIDKEFLGGFGIFNTYFIEEFEYTDVRKDELFFFIFKERISILLWLLLFLITGWGCVAGGVFLAWQSYAAGFLMTAAVSSYGIKGILLICTAVFPHYLVYIPLYISYFYISSFVKKRIKERTGQSLGNAKEWVIFSTICLLFVCVFVTGIFLESYTNPYLLKKTLKIF